MIILGVADSHVKSRNPSARIDIFSETMLAKFMELGEAAVSNKAAAVLHCGDLFDSPRIGFNLLGQLTKILRSFPCPIYVVPGNHDLYGHNVQSINQTVLGLLAAAGVINLLTREEDAYITDDIVTVKVSGQEYHPFIDKREPALDYDMDVDYLADCNILVVHGMLLEKPFHPDVPCTLISDVVTSADIVMGGHYHPGFKSGVVTTVNTVFINPGSMGRVEASKDSFERMPSYVVLDINTNEYKIKIEQFRVAKPSNEVLDASAKEAKQDHLAYLGDFRDQVNDSQTNMNTTSVFNVLEDVAKSTGASKQLEATARSAIEAMQIISANANKGIDGYIESSSPVYIESVEIWNFQSHEHSVFHFEPGLNAIVGPSDNGKSAAVRAIRWVTDNEPQGAEFLRVGAKEVKAKISYSNGYKLTRKRTLKSSGEYIVEDPSGVETPYKGFSNNIPVEVVNVHQMPKSSLTSDKSFSLNIANQLEGPFMLSESPGVRATAIGRMIGVQDVDAAIKEKGKKVGGLQREVKIQEQLVTSLEGKIIEYTDLPELKLQINQGELLLANQEIRERNLTNLQQLQNNMFQVSNEITQASEEYKKHIYLDNTLTMLDEAEDVLTNLKVLVGVKNDLNQVEAECETTKSTLSKFPDMAKLDNLISLAEDCQEDYDDLTEVKQDLVDLAAQIDTLSVQLSKLPDAEDVNQLLEEVEDCMNELEDIRDLIADITKINAEISVESCKIQTVTQENMELATAYSDILYEYGCCPICNRPIDDVLIQNVISSFPN